MNRLFMASLAVCWTISNYGATQTIEAGPGENLVAVELQVGQNRLTDLFPETPVGTIIYKFDNSKGWSAAQKYPFGWSHPNETIKPYEGAVMVLPPGASVNFTLTGEVVPLPPFNYVILNSSTDRANVFKGYNLISAKLARHLTEQRNEMANVYIYNKSLKRFAAVIFDGLMNEWFPIAPPVEGAVWYQTSEAPVHVGGTFSNTNTPVYFNNFAPAYGVDRPFYDSNCVARASGTVQFSAPGSHRDYGTTTFSANFPGYFNPSNLVRYVSTRDSIAMYDVTYGSILTDFFSVQPVSTNPPTWPVPAEFPQLNPMYPPQDITFKPGTNGQIYVVYWSIFRAPRVEQWQKKTSDGWVDIAGATNQVLEFPNMKVSDAGEYRMKLTFNCEVAYSDSGTVTALAPLLTFSKATSGTDILEVTMPIARKAKVQTSTDLATWMDLAEFTTPQTKWTTNIQSGDAVRFYQAIEVP